jgi:GntR family transcriptional regulator/MocR family aminotransferase
VKKPRTISRAGRDDVPPAGRIDLHLELGGRGVRAGLTGALREAVRTGRLARGTRLPASRALAADLGIARSTVTQAYGELVAEGWLTARQGSGTRVAQRPVQQVEPRRSAAHPRPSPRGPGYGLMPGSTDYGEFPRAAWLAAARRALTAAPHSAFGYGDPVGRIELRTALAGYLARVRGVRAEPERIVICSGFHHGLTLMARVLDARRVRAIAVESYGLDVYRRLLGDAGLRLPALRVDDDGARVGDIADMVAAGAVLLTPAHQFPTGVALSPERRAAALDWARSTGGLILEDDYDGEFRYDRQPVGALQGLDPERVVYLGTASKSLAPGLRLGWMVVPEELVAEVLVAKGELETASALDQLTLAELISSGGFDRHVRSMRQRYRRRRDQLVSAVGRRAPVVRVTGMSAGLQAVLRVPPGTEGALLRAAASQGLRVSGMAEFRHEQPGPGWRHPEDDDALVVNYAAPSESAWPGALDALCELLSAAT